jgi:glutamate racemase
MIGIFDSGIGGLTVLRALHSALPAIPLLYLADFGYAPYGNRSEQEISDRSCTILNWMKAKGVSLVVAACHTSSAVLTPELIAASGLRVVTMLEPTLNSILKHPQRSNWTKGIAVLATALSIQKGTLIKALRDSGFFLPIHPVACPDLAPLIESCQWERALAYVRTCTFSFFKEQPVDGMVYGCTHYPLIEPWIETLAMKHGSAEYPLRIDPAGEVAVMVQGAFCGDSNGLFHIRSQDWDMGSYTDQAAQPSVLPSPQPSSHSQLSSQPSCQPSAQCPHTNRNTGAGGGILDLNPVECSNPNPVFESKNSSTALLSNKASPPHMATVSGASGEFSALPILSPPSIAFYYTGTPDQGQIRLAHHWPDAVSSTHTSLCPNDW